MRNQPLSALLMIFLLGLSLSAQAKVSTRVIYGDDNRHDYFDVSDPAWRRRADATVALIRTASLESAGNQTNIKTISYGQGQGLCATERFYEQETAAFCSGFLVTPDTIVTAGHCVRNQSACEATQFVFGFRLTTSGQQPRAVSSDMVFNCSQLVHSVVNATGEDFAVVKLDRAVTHVSPLMMRSVGRPAENDPLVVMGHPAGLPLKVADGAAVRKVNPEYLVANLDTYGGNSGSAVFNGATGELEGILVRGEMDFVYQNGCRVSNRCAGDGCRGEDVTLIERVLSHL